MLLHLQVVLELKEHIHAEIYGRQVVFFTSYLLATMANIGVAMAPNLTMMLLMRFLAGTFGSSPNTNANGTIADMFGPEDRGLAMLISSMVGFLGPVLGPVVGGFVIDTIGWKWLLRTLAMLSACVWLAGTLLVPVRGITQTACHIKSADGIGAGNICSRAAPAKSCRAFETD
jgi:MFS family permease